MRQPRQDTPLSLPAERPRAALARDEALLEQVQPGGPHLERWYVATSAAVIVGLGLRGRLPEVVDLGRCEAAGVDVVNRRAGGGAVLVDRGNMLCGAVCVALPDARLGADLTASYRWLGELFCARLAALGVPGVRRVEVDEAREDVSDLKSRGDCVSRVLLTTCYGSLSPHEVVAGAAKLVGLAQVRRHQAALFQFGVLLQDQAPLADWLMVPDEPTRETLRTTLARRTVGLPQLLGSATDLRDVVEGLSSGRKAR